MIIRIILFYFTITTFSSCTVRHPKKEAAYLPDVQVVSKENIINDLPAQDTSSPETETVSQPIPPPLWEGRLFIVLKKQEFLRPLGYELYFCRNAECDTTHIDTAWELLNHRIRCDRLAGETLYVETAESDGNEYVISFLHKSTNRKIFGRTRRQTIPELASVEDLERAKKRWLGKTVFSKRGVISAFGNNSNTSLTGIRVNILDSLTVEDVRLGTTPLPVKPLWLMVKARNGVSGFIPIRYSWINTIPEEVKNLKPWEEDIFEKDPAAIYKWDEATWELINNHRVILDMTPEQVRISWGEPVSSCSLKVSDEDRFIMTYLSHELVFTKGKLTSVKERTPASD